MGNGTIKAVYDKAFDGLTTPMGVEVETVKINLFKTELEFWMMKDEVVVSNMNHGTVEFFDFDGNFASEAAKEGPKTISPASCGHAYITIRNRFSSFQNNFEAK